MNLTICLVTKGRESFLNDALHSYEKFIETGEVNVILVDNGADPQSRKLLIDWKKKNSHLVRYVQVDENVPEPYHFFWEKIRSFSPKWIVFPGDDDILTFDTFNNWRSALSNQPDLTAFATSAEIIEVSGKITGLIRSPALFGLTNKAEQLSKSLHEPPFFWPGLFFRFDAITNPVPQSRFVFDWWVGWQLVLSGTVKTTADIGVKYRVHKNQTSHQTSSRRKYFEGFHMLIEIINSKNFSDVVDSMTSEEIMAFLELCFTEKPLYSQPEYCIPLLKEITFKILTLVQSPSLKDEILERYLLSAGILTKKSDMNSFYLNSELHLTQSAGNVAIKFAKNICLTLSKSSYLFNQKSNVIYTISCKHSEQHIGNVAINCNDLMNLSLPEVADSILLKIDSQLELKGILSFNTTPLEKLIVIRIRQFKLKLPKFILKKVANIKKFVDKLT